MKDLIERLEKATGPDRQLDADILNTCGHQALDRGPRIGWEWRRDGKGIWSRMPSPTASIDAALTLLPDGYAWTICNRPFQKDFWASVADPYDDGGGNPAIGKTAATALTAAALKASQESRGHDVEKTHGD